MDSPSTFCIVGTGYVGMASSIGLASLGHRVVGYDIIRERVRGLNNGVMPYQEAGLGAALERQLVTGRLRFVEELAEGLAGADFVMVTVGTPSRPDGSADLSYLESAISMLEAHDLRGKTLVIRSTVPPGTTDRIAERLRGLASVIYAPEFLREGTALQDFLDPDRIVIGARDPVDADAYAAVFADLERPVIVTPPREAELIKAFSNAFLALKISFANEVANMCDAVDADALHVLAGVGSDRRIGRAFMAPGIGYGGPCFDKDVRALHSTAGGLQTSRELLSATLRVNHAQPLRIIAMLEEELGTSVKDLEVGVWGLTFKAGTDDVRDSLAIRIVDELIDRGARVRAFDPSVDGAHPLVRCQVVSSPLEALDAHALLVLTEWPQFREIPVQAVSDRLRRPIVIDGRNVLDGKALAACGIRYRGVGRRSEPRDYESGANLSRSGGVRRYDDDGVAV